MAKLIPKPSLFAAICVVYVAAGITCCRLRPLVIVTGYSDHFVVTLMITGECLFVLSTWQLLAKSPVYPRSWSLMAASVIVVTFGGLLKLYM